MNFHTQWLANLLPPQSTSKAPQARGAALHPTLTFPPKLPLDEHLLRTDHSSFYSITNEKVALFI